MRNAFEHAWRRRFERAAKKYRSVHAISGWSEEGLRRRFLTFVECYEAISTAERIRDGWVLDLGCGAGAYSAWLAARGHRVLALDYSEATLRVAQQRLRRTGVVLVAGEAYHLPIASAAVEVVVCIGVFQTLQRPLQALSEIRRVLRPGGLVFLMTLNAWEAVSMIRNLLLRPRADHKYLRRYRPTLMCRWLSRARLRPEEVRPVYLLPDRAGGLSRLFERWGIYRGLSRFGAFPIFLAHAVLFVARAE